MRRLQALSLLFLIAASPANPPKPSSFSFTILGEGNTSCGRWADLRRGSPVGPPEGAWVLGFITAISHNSASHGVDITQGIDAWGAMHWIDNYCAAHPLDKIETAATALTIELIKRTRTSK